MTTQNSFSNDFDFEDFTPFDQSFEENYQLPTSLKVAAAALMISPVCVLPVLGWWAAKQFTK